MAGRDDLALIVCGRKEQTIVTALFDNLGKGACGAAIQNMNIALGLDPYAGLQHRREVNEMKVIQGGVCAAYGFHGRCCAQRDSENPGRRMIWR
ncbi:MAG: hypothetical protein V8T10_09910 [Merdibacter sp.]